MGPICTLHQMIDSRGLPKTHGSEVRLPSGEAIPHVTSITTKAVAGQDYWETTITLRTKFGEGIPPQLLEVRYMSMFPDEKADGMGDELSDVQ